MGNPVFDTARATLDHALKMIEGEHDRIAAVARDAPAIVQRMEALRRNEGELNATVNKLAQQVAASRAKIEEADASARDIMAGARVSANDIASQAQHDAALVTAAAKAQVEEIIAKASQHADRLVTEAQGKAVGIISAADTDVVDIQAQQAAAIITLAAITRQIDAEKIRLDALKKKQ